MDGLSKLRAWDSDVFGINSMADTAQHLMDNDRGDGRIDLAVEAILLLKSLQQAATLSMTDHIDRSKQIGRVSEIFRELNRRVAEKDADGERMLAELEAQGA